MSRSISLIARYQLLRSVEFEWQLLCERTFDSQKEKERDLTEAFE